MGCLSYEEFRAKYKYDERDEQASGSYGQVFFTTDGKFIVKRQELNGSAITEISILSQCEHPNIATLDGISFRGDLVYFAQKRGTSIYSSLFDGDITLIQVLSDLLSGFNFLRKHGIAHKDLKAANCIIVDGRVVIIDFGLSDYCDRYSFTNRNGEVKQDYLITGVAYTDPFRDPEYMWGGQEEYYNSIKCELYSIYQTMIELMKKILFNKYDTNFLQNISDTLFATEFFKEKTDLPSKEDFKNNLRLYQTDIYRQYYCDVSFLASMMDPDMVGGDVKLFVKLLEKLALPLVKRPDVSELVQDICVDRSRVSEGRFRLPERGSSNSLSREYKESTLRDYLADCTNTRKIFLAYNIFTRCSHAGLDDSYNLFLAVCLTGDTMSNLIGEKICKIYNVLDGMFFDRTQYDYLVSGHQIKKALNNLLSPIYTTSMIFDIPFEETNLSNRSTVPDTVDISKDVVNFPTRTNASLGYSLVKFTQMPFATNNNIRELWMIQESLKKFNNLLVYGMNLEESLRYPNDQKSLIVNEFVCCILSSEHETLMIMNLPDSLFVYEILWIISKYSLSDGLAERVGMGKYMHYTSEELIDAMRNKIGGVSVDVLEKTSLFVLSEV